MHDEYLIQVEDNPNLRRDALTNAVIDVDHTAYGKYLAHKQEKQEQRSKNHMFEDRINKVESDLSDIKDLLTRLLERQ